MVSSNPTPGSGISFSNVASTSLTVNWGAATDDVTSAANLQYKLVKVKQTNVSQNAFRYDEYNESNILSFAEHHPSAEPQFRPSWVDYTSLGYTSGLRMMMRIDTSSGIAFNTIIGEPGYDDSTQSSAPGFIGGVTHSFSGYYNNHFAQLGFQATSTREVGMAAGLTGKANQAITSIKITFDSWDSVKYSQWSSDGRAFITESGFTIPITVRVYALSADGAAPGALLGEVTQNKLMQWCPEDASVSGYSYNVVFNMSSANIAVPASEKVIVSVSYNTNTHGPNPVGIPGPYDGLGVGFMEKVYDSGNGNVTYGTSAGSLVSDNGLYWYNTLSAGNPVGYIDEGKAGSSAAIDSVVEINGVSGSDLVMNWTTNTISYNVTGLTPSTTYWFAALVRDQAGNMAVYSPVSQATSILLAAQVDETNNLITSGETTTWGNGSALAVSTPARVSSGGTLVLNIPFYSAFLGPESITIEGGAVVEIHGKSLPVVSGTILKLSPQ